MKNMMNNIIPLGRLQAMTVKYTRAIVKVESLPFEMLHGHLLLCMLKVSLTIGRQLLFGW